MIDGINNNFSERFSPEVKNILVAAQKIAKSLGKPLNSVHVLSAIASTKGTLSSDLLKEDGVSVDKIHAALNIKRDFHAASGEAAAKMSSDGTKVIKVAFSKANKYNHARIGSEHLLLAIVSTKELMAFEALKQSKADIKNIEAFLKKAPELISWKSFWLKVMFSALIWKKPLADQAKRH